MQHHDADTADQDLGDDLSVESESGTTTRCVVDPTTTLHIVSEKDAELAGMTRILVPKAVSFSTENGTPYSTHYAKFVLPGTKSSLSAYILEDFSPPPHAAIGVSAMPS